MRSNLTILSRQTDLYYKLAGILKTPPSMLKKLEDWACSVYCQKALSVIEQHNIHIQLRKELGYTLVNKTKADRFNELKKAVSEVSSLRDIIPQGTDSIFNYKLNSFDEDKTDPQTQMSGVYDEEGRRPPALSLFIHNLGKGLFNFRLIINSQQEEYDSGEYDSGELNSRDEYEVLKILKKYRLYIAIILNDFLHFTLDFEIFSDDHSKYIKGLQTECARYYQKHYISTIFLNYNIEELMKMKYIPAVFSPLDIEIAATFVFTKDHANKIYTKENWTGLWDSNWNIYVFKPIFKESNIPSVSELQETLTDIKETVRHELQHAIQTFIQNTKKIKELGGLPSKKIREQGRDPSGVPIQKLKDKGDKDRISHELRDVEFHTRLKDSVEQFKRAVNKFPTYVHKMFFDLWIGKMTYVDFSSYAATLMSDKSNPHRDYFGDFGYIFRSALGLYYSGSTFFISLKDKNPAKYRKAVTEFYKEVSSLL